MPASTVDVKPIQGQPDSGTVSVYPTGSTRPEMATAGFAHQGTTVDQHGTTEGNKGCWGVDLNYVFTAVNTAGDGKTWG
ncbi:MAG TPA: hypothetical protein PKA27_10365, partial [Fimbriimonadaceae bacterium]|nr:hypothetical protein [Fimbriimonadaceae bacterium]